MVGKQTEERIEFDAEMRKKILSKTGFKCAACGEKLDMVRHTIDHIIPISRGGTNDIDNLIGLCKMCNEYKDNLLYYPGDYYTYLMVTNVVAVNKIHEHVVEYLKGEVHKLDLHRYPLISPCSTAMCYFNGIVPKNYTRQLLFDIVYMRSDMRRANSGKVNFLRNYPYYAIIKRTTQSLIAILRIDYTVGRHDPEGNGKGIAQLTIYDEWLSCTPKIAAPLMRNIGIVLTARYLDLGIQLDEICIASLNGKIPHMIYEQSLNNGFGRIDKQICINEATGTLDDREDLGDMPYFLAEFDYVETGGKYRNEIKN